MKCKICSHDSKSLFVTSIMNKYDVQYYRCEHCSFIQTEDPYWLNEAYQRPINISDVGILDRNIFLMKIVSSILFFYFNKNGAHLDYAGGYGIFTRLMRDIGYDYYWSDPHTKNLFAPTFEYNNKPDKPIETITAFEAFEHFVDPRKELEQILSISKTIIFSTQLVPSKTPQPEEWWYYGREHGQHVSLYSSATLSHLAKENGLHFYSNGINIHIFTPKKISPYILKFIFRFYDHGIFRYIRKKMKSRTESDMKMVIESLKK